MTTTTQRQAALSDSTVALEARAREDGILDSDGFFQQDDWEFELDQLQGQSRAALEEHLAKGPSSHQTAVFLKGYLLNSRDVKFTPFSE